jgi:broad specificity phosphatase PhoE
MRPIITTVDLLRHGEVQGQACYRGITDDALTPQGWQQMHNAAAKFEDWQVIISSPLCRCLDFATELSQQKKIPLMIEKGFQEIDFGDWEGKTAEQIEPQALTRFYQSPFDYAPPQGESLLVFQKRVNAAWQQLLNHQQGKSVLVICHAGVIRVLFCLLLQLPLETCFAIQVDHAGLTRFSCFHSENSVFTQLNFHNRI